MRFRSLLLTLLFALPAPPVAAQATDAVAPAATATASGELPPVDVEALEAERAARRNLERNRPSARVGRYLRAAAEAIENDEPEKAQELLAKLQAGRLNPYDLAQVYQVTAFAAYGAGDQAGAIEAFQKVIEQDIIPVKDEIRIRFSIAQLYAGLEQWKPAIAALREWFRYVPSPDPLAYYLLAIAYFQLEQHDLAIVNAETAVDLAPMPREGWLQLLAALYVQREDYQKATPVLEELVLRFPKKLYWVQLSLIYGARENYRHSLAVQQMAYAQELLTEDKELRRLARSYLHAEIPYPAAQVLEKGLADGAIEPDAEAYELLANSWIAAREYDKALAPLERGAELSDDGELFVRLGQVHLQREQWSQAAQMLHKAVEKGELKNEGNALLLLGISYFNEEQVGQARSYFARALKHDETRPQAERWLKHIDEAAAETDNGAGPT